MFKAEEVIDDGGILPDVIRILVRDGYALPDNRFRRFQDMILRFATDLPVPFTNNGAEHSIRPVKVQQKTSGGCWRTLAGLTEFALVHSYPNTAHKWGHRQLQVLQQLFTTGSWLPPTPTQLNSESPRGEVVWLDWYCDDPLKCRFHVR